MKRGRKIQSVEYVVNPKLEAGLALVLFSVQLNPYLWNGLVRVYVARRLRLRAAEWTSVSPWLEVAYEKRKVELAALRGMTI